MGELYGRDGELATLRSALHQAFAGRGGLVLISGEPGIGKTSLLDQLAEEASGLGGTSARGICWDGEGTPALWPWQRLLSTIEDDDADVLADLRRVTAGVGGDPGQFGLFSAVADHLRHRARLAPVAVVLDDLQWADANCLRLLRFVARDLRGEPILLAGAFRRGSLPEGHPIRDLVADSATLHLELSGLPDNAVAELLAEAAGASAEAQVVTRVTERTAGNPFFVREVARLLSTGEAAARLPAAIEDAVAARILTLPNETVALLGTASLIGRGFEDAALAKAHELADSALSLALAPALDAGLVETAAQGQHRFVHDLVREHLQAGLAFDERRNAHYRLVRAIEQLPRLRMRSARLAAHAVAAVPAVPPEDAALWCDQAAAEATATQAHDEAVRHLEAAVAVTGTTNDERELELADALLRAGRLVDAREGYERLAARAAHEDSPRRLGLAALGLHEVGAESQTTRAPVIAALDTARSRLGTTNEDRRLLARVTATLARELADGPDADPDRAGSLAHEAIELARELDDPAVLATCLFARHDVIWGPGTAEERRNLGEQLWRVATGHAPDLAFQGLLCRYVALLEMGDPAAEPVLVEIEDLATHTRQPLLSYLARSRRDGWNAMLGAPGVEEQIAATYELATRLEVPDGFGVYVTQLVTIDVGSADAPTAIEARHKHIGGRMMPPDYLIEERSMELLASGDVEAAAALLSSAPPPEVRSLFRWRALAAVAFSIEAGWRSGATELCARSYEHLLPYSGELIVIGGGVSVVGPVDLYLGLASDACGKRDLARTHLNAALELARVLGARPWTTRITALLTQLARADEVHATFRQDGDVWRLEYAGKTAHLPDYKGVRDLAVLLANPGQEVTSIMLAGGPAGQATGSDPVLDDPAKAAYRRRIEALDAAIIDARADGDEARLANAEDERDAIIAELRTATGLGGRSRRLGDPGERARSTVTARIKEALRRIEAVHPELAAHLRSSVRTGRACVYQPAEAVNWRL
jgi:tetratricopeptide (TPR) repeat protein